MALKDIIQHISDTPGGRAGWASFFGRDSRAGRIVFLPTGEEISHLDLLTVQSRFAPHKVELSPAAKKARRVAEMTTARNQ